MQTQPIPTANLTFALQPDAIVLHQVPAAERRVQWWNDSQYEVTDASSRAVMYMQRYGHDLRYWIGSEMARDAAGRMWKLDLGMMVMDDFGTLVQVRA